MRNTVYNLKVVFSSLVFQNFGCPFTVTACNNMSLKSFCATVFTTTATVYWVRDCTKIKGIPNYHQSTPTQWAIPRVPLHG